MARLQENGRILLEKWLWIGPAMALGLYVGRLCSELLRPGLAGALLLTIATIIVSTYALRRTDIWTVWPLLILLVYVFYPEPNPRIALFAGLATVVAMIQTAVRPKSILPLSRRAADVLSAAVLSAGFFTLYVNTLAPDLLPADAGELQLVAASWGVAHPPGFPLYTVLANLFSRLPIGLNAAYRTNLFSALTSTGAVLLLYLAVLRLTKSRLAGFLAAAALGTSTTFWSQATTANVRSMTSLFTAAAFYLLLVLRERQQDVRSASPSVSATDLAATRGSERGGLWLPALFVLLLVLAVTHHVSLIFFGGIFALYAIYAEPSVIRDRRRWPILLLAGLIALLPLLYLPVRGSAGAVGAPNNLATLNGFLNHALGLGFRGDLFYFNQASVLWTRLMVMINVMTFQFSPFALFVMLAGLISLYQADRLLALVLATSVALHTFVAAIYRAPQTVEYMLPVYVLLAVMFGYAAGTLHRLQSESENKDLRDKAVGIGATLLLTAIVMAVLAQAFNNYESYRRLSNDTTARDFARPLLLDAPADAVVLADWHWAPSLWYLQEVEGTRTDVDVQFVFPESGPYVETWVRRISEELSRGRPVIATHYERSAYASLPPAQPFQEAFLFGHGPLLELPATYTPMLADLGQDLLVEGYFLESEKTEPGLEFVAEIAWHSEAGLNPEGKLYAHLVGPDGQLYAADDQPALAQPEGLSVNQFRLTPVLQTKPGIYRLLIGSYDTRRPGETHERELAQIEILPGQTKPVTEHSSFRPLVDSSDGRTLIGYDWDSTLPGRQRLYLHWAVANGFETQSVDMDGGKFILPDWHGPWGIEVGGSTLGLERPSAYIPLGQGLVWLGQDLGDRQLLLPGQHVKTTQQFTTSRPVMSDSVVSLRLVGYKEDGRSWDWWDLDDSVPATGAIPTLKWIAGSRVQHPIFSTVSPDAWPNQESEPLLLLYDAFTSRQVPILDERIAQLSPWIPLGRMLVDSEE